MLTPSMVPALQLDESIKDNNSPIYCISTPDTRPVGLVLIESMSGSIDRTSLVSKRKRSWFGEEAPEHASSSSEINLHRMCLIPAIYNF
mmetsp:Transcript_15029/g.19819  ORF Transcript_15029/g.19819 Transcript_15029/m.19819 type:complete len:89 (+) Transcript_15029:326-592(+)